MPSMKQQIVDEIKEHIQNSGGEYSDWYVGVCSTVRYQLLVEAKSKHLFIARQAYSPYVAAAVQDYCKKRLKTDCSVGIEGDNANIIYAYRKSPEAIE